MSPHLEVVRAPVVGDDRVDGTFRQAVASLTADEDPAGMIVHRGAIEAGPAKHATAFIARVGVQAERF